MKTHLTGIVITSLFFPLIAQNSNQPIPPTSAEKILSINELENIYQRASTLYDQKKYLEAAKKYRLYATERSKIAYYNEACCWALAGEKTKALDALKKCLEAGWKNFDYIRQDPDLKDLQKEFENLLIQVQRTHANLNNATNAKGMTPAKNNTAAWGNLSNNAGKNNQSKNQAKGNANDPNTWDLNVKMAIPNQGNAIQNKPNQANVPQNPFGANVQVLTRAAPQGKEASVSKSNNPQAESLSTEKRQELYEIFQKGDSLYEAKAYSEAANKYEMSAQWNVLKPKAYYNAACCWALAKEPEKALEALHKAYQAGWKNAKKLESDPDLKSLHHLEAFKTLKEKMTPKPEGSQSTP